MAEQTDSEFLDLIGTDEFKPVEFKSIEGRMTKVAALYADSIAAAMDLADVSSSGELQDSIEFTDVQKNGSKLKVDIKALEYLSYVDEGVNGVKKNRRGRFQFKNYGVPPEMLRSVQRYLEREKGSNRNLDSMIQKAGYKGELTKREIKAKSITDLSLKAAKTAAFMIKRQGIKPKHFFRDATKEMEVVIRNELGVALRIDIINNIVK